MAKIAGFTIFSLNLPFRIVFKHAAANRNSSDSIMLKCETESGATGFGECLPRIYVTGESRDHAFNLLHKNILPRMVGSEFSCIEDVISYLSNCNGKAPATWVPSSIPQTAAWAAVDLALLDAFGKEFNIPVRLNSQHQDLPPFTYSGVCSAEKGWKKIKNLALFRIFGFRQVKIKIHPETALDTIQLSRKILGKGCDIRVDANMAWDVLQAIESISQLSRLGVHSFEQPLKPDDILGLSRLVQQTKLDIMVDESINDEESLERLITNKACTGINVRISKCGGLVGAYNRCLRAFEAGLKVQVGSQVGETSLLSAAQLILIAAVQRVTYAEGCFGEHLLLCDPAQPHLQFGYGGRPPKILPSAGLGIRINEDIISKFSSKVIKIK
jgi:L-alanine-DL-glutamate epimerase-like enolase superfamily enzyme